MKKMKLGVALLAAVLLLGIPVSTARAEDVSGTTTGSEEGGTQEVTSEKLTPLSLAEGDQSGTNWTYTAADHTLKITGDVTIEGTAGKTIESTGDLNITVASGATLTVKSTTTENKRYVIYADGNITLDGEGTINIEHAEQTWGIYAKKGITIQGITLNLLSGEGYAEICANGGALVIQDAVVTAKGRCQAWDDNSTFYPVRILGQSVVNIASTDSDGGLRGSEFEFSDCAHVKIQSKWKMICGKNSVFKLADEQTVDYYFRSKAENLFTKGQMTRTTSDEYFEYIGANHVASELTSNEDGTHSRYCKCTSGELASTLVEKADCSGGTATCTAQAVCTKCHKEYGDLADHNYQYHVCSGCGGLENGVVVAVVANGEKRGYTSNAMEDAIAFAGRYPGAVLTIIDPKKDCLDGLQVNNPQADFTIEMDEKNNGNYGSVTVSSGKVTIKDPKGGGTFHAITTTGTGTVTLASGTITSSIDVINGTFNVNGGTIQSINLTDGQINWNSSTVEGKKINYKGQGKVTINAVPKSTLSISLPINQDLSQPVAVLGTGISLPENMLAIDIGNRHGTYTLKPVVQGNQIYARLPLTQLEEDDILLGAVSGFTYDGKEQKPSVTVQRYMYEDDYEKLYKDYLTEGTDYTVTYKDNINAGTATVTITGIGCYTDSVERTFTIAKAAPENPTVTADSRTYSCRIDNEDSVRIAEYLPKDYGQIINANITKDGTLTYSSEPSVTNGVLSYTIQRSEEAADGTISVEISTTNYEDITIRIPVETKDIGIVKLAEGSSVALQNATLTEGEQLSTLKFKDAVFVDETENAVPGTLTFRTPNAVPAVGTLDAEWVFQPTDADSYAAVYGTVTVTVKEKTTSGGGSSSGGSSSGGSSSGGSSGGGGAAGTTEPKDDAKQDGTGTDDSKQDGTKQDTATPAPEGTKVKDSSGTAYQVTSDGGEKPTVAYKAAAEKSKGTVTIPKTVTIDGTKYQVTSIAAKAFAGSENIKRIVVSKNITSIGANAFAGCQKLQTITINSTKLTGKNVADSAFADIEDETVIRVPQKMLARYQKLFVKKGLSGKVRLAAIKNKSK